MKLIKLLPILFLAGIAQAQNFKYVRIINSDSTVANAPVNGAIYYGRHGFRFRENATWKKLERGQVNADWNAVSGVSQILNKPVLSPVAVSGSYNDLIHKPVTPADYWKTGGNSISGNEYIGTNNNQPFAIKANGREEIKVTPETSPNYGSTTTISSAVTHVKRLKVENQPEMGSLHLFHAQIDVRKPGINLTIAPTQIGLHSQNSSSDTGFCITNQHHDRMGFVTIFNCVASPFNRYIRSSSSGKWTFHTRFPGLMIDKSYLENGSPYKASTSTYDDYSQSPTAPIKGGIEYDGTHFYGTDDILSRQKFLRLDHSHNVPHLQVNVDNCNNDAGLMIVGTQPGGRFGLRAALTLPVNKNDFHSQILTDGTFNITTATTGSFIPSCYLTHPYYNVAAGVTQSKVAGYYYYSYDKRGEGSIQNSYGIYIGGSNVAQNNYSAYFDQNVGIGTETPTQKLEVKGNILASGNIVPNSDIRLKKDITPVAQGLRVVKQLRPVTYKKRHSLADKGYTETESGFIAQEVRHLLPQLVKAHGKDSLLSFNYNGMVAILVKAIQEQQEQMEALKSEIQKVKGKK